MTEHGRGKEVVWDEQSGIFHGSSSTNPQESDGGQVDISILIDGDGGGSSANPQGGDGGQIGTLVSLSDEDLSVLVDVIFKEKERYEQIFQNKLKKRIIRYVSERDKNYRSRESKLWPLYFSIGPTHHGDPDLQPIESAKMMHLTRLMRRVEFPQKFGIECLRGLENMMDAITSYYDTYRQCLIYFSTGQILKIILLDACFIIHLIIESKEIHGNQQEWIEINETHDAVTYMKESSLLSDFLLLENQIPFVIIDFIWKLLEKRGAIDPQDTTKSEEEEYSPKLISGILCLFNLLNHAPHGKQHYHNLLDFYHRALPAAKTCIDDQYPIPRATELQDVGIKLQLKENTKNSNGFMDMTKKLYLTKDGKVCELNVPLTNISFPRNEILRSLLAFEYDRWRKRTEPNNEIPPIEFKVFPYIHCMIHLVQNVEDATILMKAGIFDSAFTSMDDIVNFFSDLWSLYKSEEGLEFPKFKLCSNFYKHHLIMKHPFAEPELFVMGFNRRGINSPVHGDGDAHPLSDPDFQIIEELLAEFPRYYPIVNNLKKKRMIYYVSERDKNYRTRESTLPLYFSIGPIYHGDSDLQTVEGAKIMHFIKLIYKMDFIRIRTFLNECFGELKLLMLRSRYELQLDYDRHQQRFNIFSKEKVLKMLLLDASFIIHLIIESREIQGNQWDWILIEESEYEVTYMKKSSVLSDLLLFENEIPFDIINLIWKLVEKYKSIVGMDQEEPKQEDGYSQSLIEGILHLFNLNEAPHEHEQFQISIDEDRKELVTHYRNLLDFYHRFLPITETPDDRSVSFYHWFLPSSIIGFHLLDSFRRCLRIPITQTFSDRFQRETIPSATELEKVGCVKFQLKEVDTYNINSFMAIIFEDGNLYFPLTNLSIARKEILRSLLLFEYEESQQENSTNHPFDYKVFPYIYFMSCLLRNGEDAKILMNAGIFDNEIGSMEDIAKFFSDLWRPYIYVKDFKFPIFKYTKAINKRHNSKRKTFRAVIKRYFFVNPLIIFSVFSAFQILVLTYIQVIKAFK